jgi:hypothetical protein
MMKTFRNVSFVVVLISFIGWCMYYYVNEMSSKLLVNMNFYTFTALEMLIAVMGAFYIIVTVIMLGVYLIRGLFFPSSKKRV